MNWDSIIEVLMEEIKDDALRALIYKKILESSESFSDAEDSIGLDDIFDEVLDEYADDDQDDDEEEELDDNSDDDYDYEDE